MLDLKPGTKPVRGYIKTYRGEVGKWLHETVQNLIRTGQAKLSTSPWDHPILVIPKYRGGKGANGKVENKIIGLRFVADLRRLNAVTIPLHNSPPNVWDILLSLRDANILSDLDMSVGYQQLAARPDHTERLALTSRTQFGNVHFEMTRATLGLLNAQSAFIAAVNHALRHRLNKDIFCLADDITVATKDIATHKEALQYVAQQAKRYNFRLNRTKCKLLRKTVCKFGFLVGRGEVRIDPTRQRAILDYPRPRDVEGVRRLLGLAQYWRPMLRDSAAVLSPMTRLLKRGVAFRWGETEEAALTALKGALTSDVTLTLPKDDEHLYLDTDASPTGVGAVLYVMRDGKRHPVWYWSKQLLPFQRNQSTTEKELWAIVAATERLEQLVGHRPLTINCDCRNVVWLFNEPKVAGAGSIRVARWILKLQRLAGFVKLQHVPAEHNKCADALSRAFEDEKVMSLMRAAKSGLQRADGVDEIDLEDEELLKPVPFDAETVFTEEARQRADAPDPNYQRDGRPRQPSLMANTNTIAFGCHLGADVDEDDDASGTESDEETGAEVNVTRARRPDDPPTPERKMKHSGFREVKRKKRQTKGKAAYYLSKFGSLQTRKMTPYFTMPDDHVLQRAQMDEMADVVAYATNPGGMEKPVGFEGVDLILSEPDDNDTQVVQAVVALADDETIVVPVIPPTLRRNVMQLAHDSPVGGHRNWEVGLDLLERMAFWPTLRRDIKVHAETCTDCGRERPFRPRRPQSYFSAAYPGHTIHCDFTGPFVPAGDGSDPTQYKYIAVIIDRFSGYCLLVPTTSTKGSAMADALIRYYFPYFGMPKRVVTDRASAFDAEFAALSRWLWASHVRTSAYYPETNSKAERLNRTMKEQLRKLCHDEHSLWATMLPATQFRINNTRGPSGFSPHELMMGWRPRAPFLGERVHIPHESYSSYMGAFKEHLAKTWRLAAVWNERSAAALKLARDRREFRTLSFREGDEVWCLRHAGDKKSLGKAIGPCVIEKDVTEGRGQAYQIRKPDGRSSTFNARDLRPYLRRPASPGNDNEYCSWCGGTVAEGRAVRCATCPTMLHMRCAQLNPEADPPGTWTCSDCAKREAEAAEPPMPVVDRELEREIFQPDGAAAPAEPPAVAPSERAATPPPEASAAPRPEDRGEVEDPVGDTTDPPNQGRGPAPPAEAQARVRTAKRRVGFAKKPPSVKTFDPKASAADPAPAAPTGVRRSRRTGRGKHSERLVESHA
jgi:hypothetical protein